MKKFTLTALVAMFTVFGLMSCLKNSDYACKCTYVARSLGIADGEPDKEETTTVTARLREQADSKCFELESKYFMQGFDGTCIVE